MDYELEVLRTPYYRVTVWFIDEHGDRTGLYIRIIEDGRLCGGGAFEQFFAVADESIDYPTTVVEPYTGTNRLFLGTQSASED